MFTTLIILSIYLNLTFFLIPFTITVSADELLLGNFLCILVFGTVALDLSSVLSCKHIKSITLH